MTQRLHNGYYAGMRVILFQMHLRYLDRWGLQGFTFAANTSRQAAITAAWYHYFDEGQEMIAP